MGEPTPIALYVARANFLKVYGPLVAHLCEAHADRFAVRLLCPAWGKAVGRADPAALAATWPGQVEVVPLASVAAFEDDLVRSRTRVVLGVGPRLADVEDGEADALIERSRGRGTRWVSLPYIGEQDLFIAHAPERVDRCWDAVCLDGEASLAFNRVTLAGLEPSLARRIEARLVVTGFPELDGIGRLAPPAELRAKHGLPPDVPLILLASAPDLRSLRTPYAAGLAARFWGLSSVSWRSRLAVLATLGAPRLLGYREYLAALRRLADRSGAQILVKTRAKNQDPPYLADYVDHVRGDRDFYPFTTLELLAVSRLYVGFASAAAIEAVATGLYAVSMYYWPTEVFRPTPLDRRLESHYYTSPGALWNTPGASELVRGHTLPGRRRLAELADGTLDDLAPDKQANRSLLERYYSHVGTSSARVAQLLCELVDT